VRAVLERKREQFDAAITDMKKAIEIDPSSSFLKIELAILYLEMGNKEDALAVVDEGLAADPENVELLIVSGRLRHIMKKTEAAGKVYRKILELDPKRENIYMVLGSLLMENGELQDALSVYRRLVEAFPGSYTGHHFMGRIYAQQGRLDEARKHYLRALELQPELMETRFELISIYRKQKNHAAVIRLYEEILAHNPNDVQAALAFGLYCLKNGFTDRAAPLFKELGERSRTSPDILRQIIQQYIEKEAYTDARMVIEAMLAGDPANDDLVYLLGVSFSGAGEWEPALEHLLSVPAGNRFYENAVLQAAHIYRERERLDEAIRLLEKTVANPDDSANAELLFYLGTYYQEKERYADAVDILRRGIDAEPKNARLHFRLGVVYDKWGKKEACIEQMKTVLSLTPDDAHALNYLGYTYVDMGIRLDEARELIEKAIRIEPEDGYITDSLGWVYYHQGEFEKAVEVLERAVELVPDDPVILEHLGDAYLKTGKKGEGAGDVPAQPRRNRGRSAACWNPRSIY
jgi:tetratricopeptide (TPR) repeat protein